jgi:hypothetical protein
MGQELVAPKRQLPPDPHPDAENRFNRLLQAMIKPAKPAEQTPSEEDQTSDEARDEDCGDIQIPADAS